MTMNELRWTSLRNYLRECSQFAPPDGCDGEQPCEQCVEMIARRRMAKQLLNDFFGD